MIDLPHESLMLLLRATAVLAVSALLVRGLIWWLRPSSPAIQRAGWFLVLVQGVVLFHLPIELAWLETQPRQLPGAAAEHGSGLALGTPPAAPLPPPRPVMAPPAADAPAADLSPATRPSEPAKSFSWASFAATVWLAGVICLPLLAALAYVRFLWRLYSARPAQRSWRREWRNLLAAEGIGRPIPLRVTDDVGPATCWTPRGYRVFVPERVWAELSSSQRAAVLRHELAHLRRGDLWLALLVRLLALPHWFNPFAWWAVYRFVECAEWACDQAAAGPRRADAADYAKALLRLGAADLASLSCATAARGGSLSVRIRRVISARLSEDSLVKKATILLTAAGLVALNVVRVELVAKEPTAKELPQGGTPSSEPTPEAARANLRVQETSVVTGRVLDPDGRPVRGAQVGVVGRSRRPTRGGDLSQSGMKTLGLGKTHSEGRFRVTIPRISSASFRVVNVLAAASGHGLGWKPLSLDVEEPKAVIQLHREQVIHGRLVDAKGKPSPGAKVHVAGLGRAVHGESVKISFWEPPEQLPLWPAAVTTDEQGRFTIRGVNRDQGIYLQVRDERFARDWLKIEPSAEKPSEEVTLSPTPAKLIEGQVVYADTGKPVANARLTVYAGNNKWGGGTGMAGHADDSGHFRLNPYSGKFFQVTAYPPDGGPYLDVREVYEWPKGSSREPAKLALPRGVLVRGKITEAPSGESVAGASVQFYPRDSDGTNVPEGVITGWESMALSGSDGVFHIAVPRGQGNLLVHGPTMDYIQHVIGSRKLYSGQPGGERYYVHGLVPLHLKTGTGVHDVTVSLRRGVTIKGRLVGPDGKPVPKALMLTRLVVSPSSLSWRGLPTTVRGGQFELHGCDPEQTYPVVFLDSENELGAAVNISGREGDGKLLRVRLKPCGAAVSRFVDPEGKPLVGYEPSLRIVITPGPPLLDRDAVRQKGLLVADGDFVANFDRRHYWEGPVTDKQGRCTFPALIPGAKYRILWWKPDSSLGKTDFTVEAGKTLQLADIVIQPHQ